MKADAPLMEYDIDAGDEVYAFSTTRHGGVSTGAYASMNCTPYTGDDPDCVRRNCERLLQAMPVRPRRLIIPWQTHGTEVCLIDSSFLSAPAEECHRRLQGIDALMTCEPGVCLCISTADCIPILLYDRRHRAVAAVHAGWRGTVNGIVRHTLQQMRQCFGTEGTDLQAVIGPGISLQAFEVGDEVYDAFRQAGFPMERIASHQSKWHIDLPEANRLQLLEFGVPEKQIKPSGICTYTDCQRFFSARRLGVKSGRILSGIFLR